MKRFIFLSLSLLILLGVLPSSTDVGAQSERREPGVRRYLALLYQNGTDAPEAFVLENTLGVTVTYSRLGAGNYRVDFSPPISTSIGQIYVPALAKKNSGNPLMLLPFVFSRDVIILRYFDLFDPAAGVLAEDGLLNAHPFEIIAP